MFCYTLYIAITKHCSLRRKELGGGSVTISKKELLSMTGISYGQLYRWKREGLIPEEWFVKQASFTGQETYLPRDLVLERIRFILEKKDTYSLEEIREMLKTAPDSKELTWDSLIEMEEIDLEIASFEKKEEYSYLEVAWLSTLSDYRKKYQLPLEQIQCLYENTHHLLDQMGEEGKCFLIFQIEDRCYGGVYHESGKIVLENRISNIEEYPINKLAGMIKGRFL